MAASGGVSTSKPKHSNFLALNITLHATAKINNVSQHRCASLSRFLTDGVPFILGTALGLGMTLTNNAIRMQFESQHGHNELSTNCIHLRLLQRIGKWVCALQHRVYRYRYAIVMRLLYPRVLQLAPALS